MNKTLVSALAIALGLGLVGCQSAPQKDSPSQVEQQKQVEDTMASVKGTIAYRERIALPPNAVVTIKLQDVSLQDVAAVVISEQTFTTDGAQVPFDFELSYDQTDIKAKHTYSVSARIEVDGKLRFISDTSYPVITDANQTSEVNLMLVGVR
ncbi:YbaY family lipoprotein [Vibrio hangzhouensis]|uniref:YbaY family lipoprotein n=1 Tax=Vibrio hangzhouensis TaxID=462991 RepID=UPI001C944C31|nr:YbaY family lipoprotein [Vibrio hangzhouensis]MBY6197716.1 YbaY family lipoprotein [Vibrio hangzhouensis]